MRLNIDLSVPVAVHAADRLWQPTKASGVERQPLARLGEDRALAVSLVRFARGSGFAFHRHPGGEEVLVLDGVFQDEAGDHPPGTYLRYPVGSGRCCMPRSVLSRTHEGGFPLPSRPLPQRRMARLKALPGLPR
jgi:hypothetical protein